MQEILLFYTKFPEQGKVKTRLAKDVGAEHAAALSRCFIQDMLAMLHAVGRPVCVCYAPAHAGRRFYDWLGEGYRYLAQVEKNLGGRMEQSFRDVFAQGCEKAVLIGSDLPDLPREYVQEAFKRLDSHDCVLGPSRDGGYYLIGFRRETLCPDVFHDMRWSHASVLEETQQRLKRCRRNFFCLPLWDDIDNLSELQQWYKRSSDIRSPAQDTFTYIEMNHLF